ncbi:hypothetical protein I315_03908 [Cryptococcus gattii Ru294]|nr:hypothetical protein I315_03908 [Cryptococcus gattii Ru294]
MTWPNEPEMHDGKTKYATNNKGRTFQADIILPCTGQRLHISLMAELNPALISPMTSRIRVLPTQQQFSESSTPTDTAPWTFSSSSLIGSDEAQLQTQEDYNHIFAIGDCAQTRAIQAGHTAFGQGEVAARNILRLIAKEEEGVEKTNDEELEEYEAPKPAIKLTLGIKNGVLVDGESVTPNNTGEEDLQAQLMGLPNAMSMDINE